MFLFSQNWTKKLQCGPKKIIFSKTPGQIFKIDGSKWSVWNVLLGYVNIFRVILHMKYLGCSTGCNVGYQIRVPIRLGGALTILTTKWYFILRSLKKPAVNSLQKIVPKFSDFRPWALHEYNFWVIWWHLS